MVINIKKKLSNWKFQLTMPLHISSFMSTLFTLRMWYEKSRASNLLCWLSRTIRAQPAQFRPSPNNCLE